MERREERGKMSKKREINSKRGDKRKWGGRRK